MWHSGLGLELGSMTKKIRQLVKTAACMKSDKLRPDHSLDRIVMDKRKILCFVLFFYPILTFAQNVKLPRANIVVTKVRNSEDSLKVRALFLDGLRDKLIQDLPGAIGHFDRVIELDPSNDAAMYELASIYNSQGDTDKAEVLMRRATAVNPDNFWYWILLEDIYAKASNAAQLELVYDQLIRLNPDSAEYYLVKAAILIDENKLEEAARVYAEIEKRFGTNEQLTKLREQIELQKGKSDKTVSSIEQLIKNEPKEVNNYIYLADIYAQLGNREKAVQILEKAKEIDGNNSLVLLSLAENYRELKCFEEAFSELEKVFKGKRIGVDDQVRLVLEFLPLLSNSYELSLAESLALIIVNTFPNEAKAHALYGDILLQRNSYSAALKAYREALKFNSQVYIVWEQILRIEISNGDYAHVINDGKSALRIFPNQVALYVFTGMAHAWLQRHQEAIAYLQQAIGLKPTDSELLDQIYTTLGSSYNSLKRYKESDDAFENALTYNPLNSYTLNNYAFYLAIRGVALDKALKMSQQAIALNPNNSSLEDTYAWILFKQKKYQEARLWIEKAIQNDHNGGGVQKEHYGDILFHLGEKREALEQWKRAKASGNMSDQLERKINEQKYIE